LNYYQLSIDDEINIKQWIEDIKEYNHNEYIYDLISVFNVDDTEQYSIFQKYADIAEDDYDQEVILVDAQYS
jgi:alkyl hydroperoxide reductase subunit AhpC